MDYREIIELKAKETIGYNEAEDKKSFMTGVSVAISKMEDVFNAKMSVKQVVLS